MRCGVNQPKMRAFLVRALSFSAAAALTLNPALAPVVASDYRVAAPMVSDGQANARFLSLGVGKSVVIDLPRDLNGVRAALKQSLPHADIQIDGVGDGVVLTGTASSPIEAQQAADLAARLTGGGDKVVNSIIVRGRDQVMLKVTVAEVARSIIKQMGIDLSASMNYGTAVVNFNNTNPFSAFGRSITTSSLQTSFGSPPSVQATLRAMESAGVVRTLAEPNLTAIS